MDHRLLRTLREASAPRLRTLLALVIVAALGSALAVQTWRGSAREARLALELQAERTRAQAYFRLARLSIDRQNRRDAEDARLKAELEAETARFRRDAARLRTGIADNSRKGTR